MRARAPRVRVLRSTSGRKTLRLFRLFLAMLTEKLTQNAGAELTMQPWQVGAAAAVGAGALVRDLASPAGRVLPVAAGCALLMQPDAA